MPELSPTALPTILVVDDSDEDFIFFERVARELLPGFQPVWIKDGSHAKDLLSNPATRKPRLIVTDLKMSMCSGYDFLDWLRTAPEWKETPVFVLTSSAIPEDEERCRLLGAKKFLAKPSGLNGYSNIMSEILDQLKNSIGDPQAKGI